MNGKQKTKIIPHQTFIFIYKKHEIFKFVTTQKAFNTRDTGKGSTTPASLWQRLFFPTAPHCRVVLTENYHSLRAIFMRKVLIVFDSDVAMSFSLFSSSAAAARRILSKQATDAFAF